MNRMNSSIGKPNPLARFQLSDTMRKITDTPDICKPQEKLIKKDVSMLSNVEPLAILIGMGVSGVNVIQVASEVEECLYKHEGEGFDLI